VPGAVAALALLAAAAPAAAEDPAAAGPAIACCVIPAETPVEVELLQAIGSGRSRTGEMFPVRLAAPIVIGGRTLVPAGAGGMGEIVHAAPRRLVSRAPGELILALRYLDAGGTRIPLHRLRFSHSGRVGPGLRPVGSAGVPSPGMGMDLDVPVGTRLEGRTRDDVAIPAP